MAKQTIQFEFDMESVWNRIRSRRCVFLDTNAWIHMSDEVDNTARRVRDDLKARFAGLGGDEGFYRRLLVELPALHNFVDLMVEADMQPSLELCGD